MRKTCESPLVKGILTIKNDRGLHTRPSTELVKCAGHFRAQIFLSYKKLRVNAKSLLGVLMLAATKGVKLKVEAEGLDAEEAVQALQDLAAKGFNIKY